MKPASKALGLHGVFKRGKARKYLIADSAFKRLQVDAPGACWLDANEHHVGLAVRTGGALNCSEWNDGREALRLGHDASLEQAGAQHSLSPVMPSRRSGDCLSMRLRDLKLDSSGLSYGTARTCCTVNASCALPSSQLIVSQLVEVEYDMMILTGRYFAPRKKGYLSTSSGRATTRISDPRCLTPRLRCRLERW